MTRPVFSFLLPNGSILPRHQLQLLHRNLPHAPRPNQHCRQVTGSATAKPGPGTKKYEAPKHRTVSKEQLVIGMPDKYRPPSHGRRLKEQIPRSYGPELTREQKVEQSTKQYPNSFPPQGTWMFWFLTCKQLHAYIALVSIPCFLPSVPLYTDPKQFRKCSMYYYLTGEAWGLQSFRRRSSA